MVAAHSLSLRSLCIVSLNSIEKLSCLYRRLLSGPVIDLGAAFILAQVNQALIASFMLLKNLASNHCSLVHHELLSDLSLRGGLPEVIGSRLKGSRTLCILALVSLDLLKDVVAAGLPLELLKHEVVG